MNQGTGDMLRTVGRGQIVAGLVITVVLVGTFLASGRTPTLAAYSPLGLVLAGIVTLLVMRRRERDPGHPV
jgi:TRAP-type mannitol/chloroaromatic compound transport system permease large subunit